MKYQIEILYTLPGEIRKPFQFPSGNAIKPLNRDLSNLTDIIKQFSRLGAIDGIRIVDAAYGSNKQNDGWLGSFWSWSNWLDPKIRDGITEFIQKYEAELASP